MILLNALKTPLKGLSRAFLGCFLVICASIFVTFDASAEELTREQIKCQILMGKHKLFQQYSLASAQMVSPPFPGAQFTGVFSGPSRSEIYLAQIQIQKPKLTFETDRLLVRAFSEEDVDKSLDILVELALPSSRSFYSGITSDIEGNWRPAYTLGLIQLQTWWLETGLYGSNTLITHKSTGEILGVLGWTAPKGAREFKLSYIVWEKHRGQGYVKEAVKGLVDVLAEGAPNQSIIIELRAENRASAAVALGSGFIFESAFMDRNGIHKERYRLP